MNGYILLWRKITETSFYKKPNCAHLAIFLLLRARWKKEDSELIIGNQNQIIKRGQCWVGRHELSEKTGLSEQNVRTALQSLNKCSFLTSKSTNKGTLISICNYEGYQDQKDYINQQSNQPTNQQLTSNQPHKKESNKDNEGNKNKIARNDKPSEPKPHIKLSDDAWIESLRPDCIKQGIDIDKEIISMKRWLSLKPGRKMTQRFVINWLNKCDKNVQPAPKPNDKPVSAYMLTKRLDILEQELGHARNYGRQDDIKRLVGEIKDTKRRIKEATN